MLSPEPRGNEYIRSTRDEMRHHPQVPCGRAQRAVAQGKVDDLGMLAQSSSSSR